MTICEPPVRPSLGMLSSYYVTAHTMDPDEDWERLLGRHVRWTSDLQVQAFKLILGLFRKCKVLRNPKQMANINIRLGASWSIPWSTSPSDSLGGNTIPILGGINGSSIESCHGLRPLKPSWNTGIFDTEELLNGGSLGGALNTCERGVEALVGDLSRHFCW